jgi:hypothetical protein
VIFGFFNNFWSISLLGWRYHLLLLLLLVVKLRKFFAQIDTHIIEIFFIVNFLDKNIEVESQSFCHNSGQNLFARIDLDLLSLIVAGANRVVVELV